MAQYEHLPIYKQTYDLLLRIMTATKFESRSMPQALSGTNLKTYRVIKPFKVMSGTIAPWYGQKGGGTQFMSTMTASKLLEKGYIKEVK